MVAQGTVVDEAPETGFYQAPTLLRDVPVNHRLAQEEVFGPVLAAMQFADEDEAVALANATQFGLVAEFESGRGVDVAGLGAVAVIEIAAAGLQGQVGAVVEKADIRLKPAAEPADGISHDFDPGPGVQLPDRQGRHAVFGPYFRRTLLRGAVVDIVVADGQNEPVGRVIRPGRGANRHNH